MAKLRRGMRFAEGFAQAKRVHVRRTHKHSAILEIVLDEGRNREVRRLLAKIGHKVVRLQRVAIGPLRLGNLKPGESRSLGREEVEELNRAAQQGRKRKPATRRPTAVVDQRVRDETKPIIDYSLPPDSEGDEESWPTADVELTAFVSDEAALTAAEEAALTAADENFEDTADDEDDVAPVDLSPIVPGKLKRNQRTTVIGGSQRREGRKGGTGRGRRQQGRNRNSRNRQGRAGPSARQERESKPRTAITLAHAQRYFFFDLAAFRRTTNRDFKRAARLGWMIRLPAARSILATATRNCDSASCGFPLAAVSRTLRISVLSSFLTARFFSRRLML